MESSPLPFTVQQWNRTMKQDSIPVLTLSIRRPSFPETGKTARMERYFSEVTKQWKKRWETILFSKACQAKDTAMETGQSFLPWQAKLDFAVTLWKPPLLSLRFDAVETNETSRPFLICSGETWDCATGYPRTLRSFFSAQNVRWRKDVMENMRTQASARLASGESLLDNDCTQVMDRVFDSDHYYLTEEGISIFYPLYTLGPYAEGIPVFKIPAPVV